jgi:hypothetical protein
MIGDTTGTEAFTIHVAGDRGEVGVKRGTHDRAEDGDAVLGAEDDVREKIGKGLRHGDESGFQPSCGWWICFLGRRPRLV